MYPKKRACLHRRQNPLGGAGHRLAKLPDESEAVLKQLATWLNVPVKVVADPDGSEKDLVLKTIMRKRRFETPNPEIQI